MTAEPLLCASCHEREAVEDAFLCASCCGESERGPADDYRAFLEAKVPTTFGHGADVPEAVFSPKLKPHQRTIARWLIAGARRACFASFGLGKTAIQLEACRVAREQQGGLALITMPLGVVQEFERDAAMLGVPFRFIRDFAEVDDERTIYGTNYEPVRDGKLDPRRFSVTSLDEAAVLRSWDKTYREFLRLFGGSEGYLAHDVGGGIPYRFLATATPSPNDYLELLHYAAYLGIMDVDAGRTRFFQRDSEHANNLTLRPHKEEEFWRWVASWALFLDKPSDLGPEYADDGYVLPELDVRWHRIPTNHAEAGVDNFGQHRMFRNTALGVQDAAREKRDSLPERLAKLMELRAEDPGAHRILWHDLESERHALEAAIPGLATVYGGQDLADRMPVIRAFADGALAELGAKPVMLGSGANFQRHCAWAIFLGIGFKFADFIQAIHRLRRYLQPAERVRIDLIYTEAEDEVRKNLEDKWQRHDSLVAHMTGLIRQYGLGSAALAATAGRSLGCERVERSGPSWRMVNADSIEEAARMDDASVDLLVTSPPFSCQYEYSPSYNDLGHTDNDDHFFRQMDFLTPNLFRVLKPGRIAAIHVKDRIVYSGQSGYGFQSVCPFSDRMTAHFLAHGFAFLGRKVVITDVVRENNQTYRLGWTEECKDGSKLGCGLPEYVLLFRKPPSDSSDGYADVPVVKRKADYSRARWQLDAHAFSRSSGDRLLTADEVRGLSHERLAQVWRQHALRQAYDFEAHVQLGEDLERRGRLPASFMLLPPASWHPDVWDDVARMRTLNTQQERKGKEQHLCPLPLDIVERLIVQFSMPGEVVFDPFAGLGTVPYCAVKLGRVGWGCELSPTYFRDAVGYCEAAARQLAMPSLFAALQAEQDEDADLLEAAG